MRKQARLLGFSIAFVSSVFSFGCGGSQGAYQLRAHVPTVPSFARPAGITRSNAKA